MVGGDREHVEIAQVRRVCDDTFALLTEAMADCANGRPGVRVPMLLMLACGRLKDNGLTTPEAGR